MTLRASFKALVPESIRRAIHRIPERVARGLRNLRADLRILRHIRLGAAPIADLNRFEKRVCSQNGEDGILAAIFAAIGVTDRFCVEFGVEDGRVCNTGLLRRQGWSGLWMDPAEGGPDWIRREFVTAETVNELFDRYGVPERFDLLSIDIDGNDYWVWKAVAGRRPRVVVVEYNAGLGARVKRTVPYRPDFRWDGTDYFGASLRALADLGAEKGYRLVACDSSGVNAFFVADELAGRFARVPVESLFRPLGQPHLPGPPAKSDARWVEP